MGASIVLTGCAVARVVRKVVRDKSSPPKPWCLSDGTSPPGWGEWALPGYRGGEWQDGEQSDDNRDREDTYRYYSDDGDDGENVLPLWVRGTENRPTAPMHVVKGD